jgi:hypothetical protein
MPRTLLLKAGTTKLKRSLSRKRTLRGLRSTCLQSQVVNRDAGNLFRPDAAASLMLNEQSDSGPRGDGARPSASYAYTAQSIGHLRMPALRQRGDGEKPLRPGPETSYLQAGAWGEITKDDADCWPCRRLD